MSVWGGCCWRVQPDNNLTGWGTQLKHKGSAGCSARCQAWLSGWLLSMDSQKTASLSVPTGELCLHNEISQCFLWCCSLHNLENLNPEPITKTKTKHSQNSEQLNISTYLILSSTSSSYWLSNLKVVSLFFEYDKGYSCPLCLQTDWTKPSAVLLGRNIRSKRPFFPQRPIFPFLIQMIVFNRLSICCIVSYWKEKSAWSS